jgi:hypothetical protein
MRINKMAAIPLAYEEFYILLAQKMTPQEILDFKASPKAHLRAHKLLDKNNAGTITDTELEELDRIIELERVFMLLKANALKELKLS